jgi:predicted amidohydrolase
MKLLICIAALACAPVLAQPPNLVPNPDFRLGSGGEPVSWKTWAPVPGLRPAMDVVSEPGGRMLRMTSHDFASFGKWLATGIPVERDHYYRFEVLYRPTAVSYERVSVGVMLSWSAPGGQLIQRDYIDRIAPAGNSFRLAGRTLRAPDNADSVTVELWLRSTPSGSVCFKSPRLVEAPRPATRLVRVLTTKVPGRGGPTIADNLKCLGDVLDRAGREHPDIILLTEAFPSRGVAGKAYELAQTIPGPATEVLFAKARQYKSYIIAGLLESAGGRTYNSAVLIDREGRLAGKYRKTHPPLAETEEGITPGSDYPVFDTDFGRIGILICWDYTFPETMRILRLKKAEIVFLAIAGDPMPGHYDTITRARAIDNGVFFVTSVSQGSASRIINPEGEVLAEAAEGFAIATLDLARQTRVWWYSVGPADGEPKSLFLQERRPDTYGPLIAGQY